MPNSQGFNVSQSAWALDAVEDFETSPIYTAGTANSGAAGELQNDYTIVHGGEYFSNEYALSCSTFGITWPLADPTGTILNPWTHLSQANYPAFEHGVGVQVGYETAASISPLPGAGTYKTGNDWDAELGGGQFSLVAWIKPVKGPTPWPYPDMGLTFGGTIEGRPRPESWSIFHFGSTRTTSIDAGSIYLALDKRGNPPDFMYSSYHLTAAVVYDDGVGNITLSDGVYTTNDYEAVDDISSGSFIHLAMTYDQTKAAAQDRIKLYLNGSQISTPELTYNNPGAIPGGNNLSEIGNACFIGNAKRAGPAPFGLPLPIFDTGSYFWIFNGLIDEPSVWKKTLDASEITSLYNSGRVSDLESSAPASSLVSWWRCGDTTGDTSGGQNTAILKDIGPFAADAANITDMTSLQDGINKAALFHTSSGNHPGMIVELTTASVPPQSRSDVILASPLYNRKQTLKSVYSVVDPNGIAIPERDAEITNLGTRWSLLSGCSSPYLNEAPLGSIEPYGGSALWEADRLAGTGNPFVSSPRSPFYDSYNDYAVDTKTVFKAGTILSEFRISDHIKKYAENDDFLIDTNDDFSIFGIPTGSSTSPQNSSEANFNEYYTNSEFMQFFDVVKTDHQGVAIPSEITIKCKALKKFIPYDGFYPSERSLQIASQFSKSYSEFIETQGIDSTLSDAASRPLMAAMFSPGILYNSIKAGIAVDYPVAIDSVSKFEYTSFVSGSTELTSSGYWALGTGSSGLSGWDYRVPFEALLEPEEYLQDRNISDMEPDPSCSLDLVTKLGQTGDNLYKLMMNNFLAEIPEFFLRNDEFTAIRSIPDNSKDFGKVEAGKTYGMRVKLRRSMNTTRRWYHPSFPATIQGGFETITGYELPQDPIYQPDLKETFTMYSRPSAFGPPVAAVGTLFNPETGSLGASSGFTDTGRQSWAGGVSGSTYTCSLGQLNQDLYPSDSLDGYNPSFTPPYYNGEAWADILYTSPSVVTGNVSLDDILNNSKIIYWRIDGKPILRTSFQGDLSLVKAGGNDWITSANLYLPFYQYQQPALWAPSTSSTITSPVGILGLSSYNAGDSGTGWHFWGASSTWNGSGSFPMAPEHANKFAMQLSASINLLGREDVLVQDFTPDGKRSQESTVNLSGRWVIQPKFETPMFNFGDQSIRPISSASNTLTIPTHGSESVPRGMWHQYGCLPRPNEGIYLEVADIPENWINFRGAYTGSEKTTSAPNLLGGGTLIAAQGSYQSEHYDDYGSGNGVSSLMSVAGFTQTGDRTDAKSLDFGLNQKKISKKLGQLKQKKTVGEAIVAIPFYLEEGNQKLFSIDKNKIQAILDQQAGTLPITEDSKIGQSMFDLVAKMQKYVLPPRYDFVNNPEILDSDNIGAFAMYIFEFEHTFDAEDLSYIWQNVQPNAGLKSVFGEPQVESSITHSLTKNELLDAEDFDKEIRWHVFKVKQRAAKNYFEKTTANKLGKSSINLAVQDSGAPSYNWPYDFFSLIELGNMSTQVSLKKGSGITSRGLGTSIDRGDGVTVQDPISAPGFEGLQVPEFNFEEKE